MAVPFYVGIVLIALQIPPVPLVPVTLRPVTPSARVLATLLILPLASTLPNPRYNRGPCIYGLG